MNSKALHRIQGRHLRVCKYGPDELVAYQRDELPIRLGSTLKSKLDRKYWELPHCSGIPFVIALETFHDGDSLGLTEAGLRTYLYGMDQTGSWGEAGNLELTNHRIVSHAIGTKEIPSGLFLQLDARPLSAVLFTNSGTHAKFSRMGFAHGYAMERLQMIRMGYSFNPDEDAMDPTFFSLRRRVHRSA